MRKIATLGAGMALLFSGAVVLAAASPSPSPSSSPQPLPTPRATTAPKATPTPSPFSAPTTTGTTTESTFSAKVLPLQISGSANVVEAAGGTGTVTLRVSGLLDAQLWTVDIDGGTVARPNERVEIAFKAGADITRLTMDTVRIHLTRTEMHAFLNARKAGGVVAVVSDGTRLGYAEFSAT